MKTSTPKPSAPAWILVDADGATLGRMASRIAHLLRGKHKTTFSPHLLCGDYVVVINAARLSFGQRKLTQKTYYSHSGYLGHLRRTTLGQMMGSKPEKVVELAVKRMLAKNRLRDRMMKRLHVFAGPDHPYGAQKPVSLFTLTFHQP